MTVNGEPEAIAGEQNPTEIAKMIRQFGYVLIRGALNREIAQLAGKAIAKNARALQKVIGKEVNDMPLCFADDGKFDPIKDSGINRSWYFEGARNYKLWFWENGANFPNRVLCLLQESILARVFEEYFATKSCVAYEHCTVRYQDTRIRDLSYPFHQDGNYQSRLISERTGLTTWIPFVDCGDSAPGLQIVKNKFEEVLPAPAGASMPILATDTNYVMEHFGNQLWNPVFRAGDVIVFDNFTVHRTYLREGMTHSRQSSDFRVFPVNHLPGYIKNAHGWKFEL